MLMPMHDDIGRTPSIDRRLRALLAALLGGALIAGTVPEAMAAPSPRAKAQAKTLLKRAKALRGQGDNEGALNAYLKAHELAPKVKPSKWIVRRYLKTGRKLEAAAFLERIIRDRRPAKALKWAAKAYGPLMAAVDEARAVEAKAQAKAAAREADVAKARAVKEARVRAAAQAEKKVRAQADAKAKAEATRHAAELTRTTEESAATARVEADEAWRAKIKAKEEARALPAYLILSGAAVAGLGLIGSSSYGGDAADKRVAAAECWSDLLQYGRCSDTQYNDLQAEAQDRDLMSTASGTVAALGLVTAAAGGVLLWQVVRAEPADEAPGPDAEAQAEWWSDPWVQASTAFGASALFMGAGAYHGWWGGRVVERREALRGTARVPATLFTKLDEDAASATLTANVYLGLSVVAAGSGAALLHLSGEAPWIDPGSPESPESPAPPDAPAAPQVGVAIGPTGVGVHVTF